MKKLLLGAALVAATFTASAQPRPRVSNTEFSAVLVNNMDIAAATEIQQLLFPGADWPATPHIIVAAMRIPAGRPSRSRSTTRPWMERRTPTCRPSPLRTAVPACN